MKTIRLKVVLSLALLLSALPTVHAGWVIGVGVGPAYRPYPYYYRPYPYYPYYAPPVVVAAPPVVYAQPPAVVAPPSSNPAAVAPSSSNPPPAPAPIVASTPLSSRTAEPPLLTASVQDRSGDLNQDIQRLGANDAQVRLDSAMTLGRNKVTQAVPALERMLAEDRNSGVRDAAARALGLIGSPSSLRALQNAALSDNDPEVRQSSRFAADAIRAATPR